MGISSGRHQGSSSDPSRNTSSSPGLAAKDDHTSAVFLSTLMAALDNFDWEQVAQLCDAFKQQVRSSATPPADAQAAAILNQLRRKWCFREMRQVAEALIDVGQYAPRVRRLYVQSLLDEGDIEAGLAVAAELVDDAQAEREWTEARGLIGRAYKQRYVATGLRYWLERAVDAYLSVFEERPAEHFWHGINAAALLARAESHFGGLPDRPRHGAVALQVLRIVEDREHAGTADAWSRATAMEAAVALGRHDDALQWARKYVHSEWTDAFELASTLRQLKEIWQLNKHQEPGSLLLPLLEAELLKRHGGIVPLQAGSIESDQSRQLQERGQLEKVFGRDSYLTYKWYQLGLERCRAVARIETRTGQGVGTGFLVREPDFLASGAGQGQLLLTNAHVLSRDGAGDSLTSEQAYLRFEGLNHSLEERYTIQQIIATSGPTELDFTLARLDRVVQGAQPFLISRVQLQPTTRHRLYAIGHPLGGGLSFSLHDNLLLDLESPYLHYRTPTDPGSSGSPIFDDQWNLVALHHAGSKQMRRLRGQGFYEANEGILITAIQTRLSGRHESPGWAASGSSRAATASNYTLQSSHRSPPQPGTGWQSMNGTDKQSQLRGYVRQITTPDRLETLKQEMPAFAPRALESTAEFRRDPTPEDAERAVTLLQQGQPLGEAEMLAMEAIVLPRERPVVFVQNDTFTTPESPWQHFTDPTIKANIDRAIRSIGRVELPTHVSIPFGGTGFVVGPGLLMTNRHVAEIFAVGLGRSIVFRAGQTAGWDYRCEQGSPQDAGTMLDVERIIMIHPYWDMALLQVTGLSSSQEPLKLSVKPPEELSGREVAVIGYPAKDWRNDSTLQDRIFKRVYNVKRLQPGKIVGAETIRSFENNVAAMTHDSSTLGGNSGSAVVDARTGDVIGLHFAGIYLKANYAVPTYELARDGRVVATGVNFTGSAPPNAALDPLWRRLGPEGLPAKPDATPQRVRPAATSGAIRIALGNSSVSLPFEISFQPGETAERKGESATATLGAAPSIDVLEAIKPPVIFPRLDERKGYDRKFLRLSDNEEVPLPQLTEAGEKIVARLDDGSPELKYHHFSVVMHKKRRLALFTAANVDWRTKSRRINGKKPSRAALNGFTKNDRELWVTDERIPESHQLPDLFFTKDGGAFDRGHIVRRDDVTWGKSFKDMQKANGDTFHTTNCSPQVAGFNQSSRGEDNWGDLENMIQQQSSAERVSVFSGPVLDDDEDLRFEGLDKRGEVLIKIPSRFWKIVVAKGENGPEAFGFVLEQDLTDVALELAVPIPWRLFMKSIADIERSLFGKATLDWLKQHDQFESPRGRRLASRVRR